MHPSFAIPQSVKKNFFGRRPLGGGQNGPPQRNFLKVVRYSHVAYQMKALEKYYKNMTLKLVRVTRQFLHYYVRNNQILRSLCLKYVCWVMDYYKHKGEKIFICEAYHGLKCPGKKNIFRQVLRQCSTKEQLAFSFYPFSIVSSIHQRS